MARRFKIILLATTVALALSTTPALAAKGGGGSSGVTGTIALVSDAVSRLAVTGPTYGSEVGFATAVEGRLASQSTVYVTVVCTQGSTVVYQYSQAPDFAFPLFDQAGQGLDWDGGEADCSATLIYKESKGKRFSITQLDVTRFHVSAG